MGWQDRDWAQWTDDERRRYLGGGRRRRTGAIWQRRLSAAEIAGIVGALVVCVALLSHVDASAVLARAADESLRPTLGLPGAPAAAPGGAWPDGLIPYFNAAPEHDWAVAQAVASWNASGAQVRFVAVPRSEAKVVIESSDAQPCGHGRGTLGYSPSARVVVFKPRAGHGCDRFSAARIMAHELGHVLGLGHTATGCAVMNPAGSSRGSSQCVPSAAWRWRCRLLEPADVLAAADLYGGSPAPNRPETCPLYRAVNAPAAIRLVRERSTQSHLAVGFRRPPDAVPPAHVEASGEPAFEVSYGLGKCVARPDGRRFRWSVAPGGEETLFRPILGSGLHCLRVWASDALGRRSGDAATLEIDVTA